MRCVHHDVSVLYTVYVEVNALLIRTFIRMTSLRSHSSHHRPSTFQTTSNFPKKESSPSMHSVLLLIIKMAVISIIRIASPIMNNNLLC